MNIRTRLALGVALQTALVVLVVAAVQFLALRSFLTLAEYERLEQLLPSLQHQLQARGAGQLAPGQAPLNLDGRVPKADARVLRGAQVLAATTEFPALAPDLPSGFAARAGHQVLVAPLRFNGRPATIQLASDVLGVVNPLGAYLRALAVTLPAAAALMALLSFLGAGRLLRPIARLEEAAAALGARGDLRAPLPGVGQPGEVGRLARTLQATFGQLADAREREHEFTRAAAHDLRGPLAALRARLQGTLAREREPAAYRAELRELLTDVSRLQTLTERLLLLAHDAGPPSLRPLDLAQLAGQAVDRARESDPARTIDFSAEVGVQVPGDEQLLAHLLDNLLDNALCHAGHAEVRLRVEASPAGATLSVSDDGPGVPEAALAHLTEPFFRADPARSGPGNGLGLSVARRMAEAHGAQLRFRNLCPHGFEARVDFPPPADTGAGPARRPFSPPLDLGVA